MKRMALFGLLFFVLACRAAPPGPTLTINHWGYHDPVVGDQQWAQFTWGAAPEGATWVCITGYLEIDYTDIGLGWLTHDARQFTPGTFTGGTSSFTFLELPTNLGSPTRAGRIRLIYQFYKNGQYYSGAQSPLVNFLIEEE